MSLYCFENARTPEQLAEMKQLEDAGTCIFCPDVLANHPRQRILYATEHWNVTPNEWPYAGTSLHLLLVPRQHVTDMLELPPEARNDFWTAMSVIAEHHDLSHYGLGIRNGDCRYTRGTIRHLHAHVLVSSKEEDAPEVRMRFS